MSARKFGIRYNLESPADKLSEFLSKEFVAPPSPPAAPETHRTCPKCQRYLLLAGFYSKSGKRYSWCQSCRKAKAKAEYKHDRARHLDRKAIKAQLLQQFGAQCDRCGYQEFDSALEFHHRNRKTKDSQVSKLIGQYAVTPSEGNWDKLVAECGKCIVLCSNCHQALHAGDW